MRLLRSLSMLMALSSPMAPAQAQDAPVHLKLAHWAPTTHSLQKAIEDWGSSLQQATNGSVTFTIYPAQQLGKAFDHFDMARDGIADVAYVNPGYQPGRFPIIDAGNLPFTIADGRSGSQALHEWYQKYAAAEMKEVKFCLAFVQNYGSFHSRSKKIEVPADIRGMKVRPAQAMIATLVTQLGGTNVQGSVAEARDIMEKGVADAITFPWGSLLLFGVDKVTRYHMNVPLYVSSLAWVMNKGTYERISPAQRKAVDDHCTTEWAGRIAGPWADFERSGIAKLVAESGPGREVYTLTPGQLAEWKKAAEPVVKAWADSVRRVGQDPDKVLSELKATVAKYHALD